jgi:hypothetical protein
LPVWKTGSSSAPVFKKSTHAHCPFESNSLLVRCSFSAHAMCTLMRPWTPEFPARLRVKLRGCTSQLDGLHTNAPSKSRDTPPGMALCQHRLPISSRVESRVQPPHACQATWNGCAAQLSPCAVSDTLLKHAGTRLSESVLPKFH